MTIKVFRDGSLLACELADEGVAEANFVLKDSDGNKLIVDVPIELDSSFSKKHFDLYFLSKKDVKESDIYQVYLSPTNTRIGWIIPTLSLSSSLHDYAKNEHFKKYAYIAVRESLKTLNDSVFYKDAYEYDGQVRYSDIFHENTVFLVVSKETLEGAEGFDIQRATPSLIKHGYVELGSSSPDNVQFYQEAPTNARLVIEQISQSISYKALISDLLNKSFAVENNPAFRFFYLYQLFELLMEEIFQIEQGEVVKELISANGDSGKTKDGIEKLNKFLSERKRLDLLINKYTQTQSVLTELGRLCNSLLKNLGRTENNNFNYYFYGVRNFIFHQYRDFPAAEAPLLDEIVNEVLEVLPTILAKFTVSNSAKA